MTAYLLSRQFCAWLLCVLVSVKHCHGLKNLRWTGCPMSPIWFGWSAGPKHPCATALEEPAAETISLATITKTIKLWALCVVLLTVLNPTYSSSDTIIANSVNTSQNSSSIFTCMSVCVCSSVTFLFLQTLSSRNLSHSNIFQFKFRIRTDYFGLVLLI